MNKIFLIIPLLAIIIAGVLYKNILEFILVVVISVLSTEIGLKKIKK
jgi:hypothetical protein